MRKKRTVLLAAMIFCLCLSGCGSGSGKMKSGYYTAKMSEYDHGWKEYVCILVKNNKIVSIEFNAENPSGFIKAWDNAYMESMKPLMGTYPNEYTRLYGSSLIETQDIAEVDVVTGATTSGGNFRKLVEAAVEQARNGNAEVAVVE